MSTRLSVPESCTQCAHFDQFHSTCSHPSRQAIVQELRGESDCCPMFAQVRAEAMRDLARRVGDGAAGESDSR
ncbi:hypothetical protein [Halovenus marina]|uniref:hypothetical protein n=1 Tax=Halovenus marina TaxID=3396621 RepID=UPI003F55C374